MTAFYMIRHTLSRKAFVKNGKSDTADLFPYERLEDNYIVNKDGSFSAVLEIRPLEFRLLSGEKQDYIIDGAMTAVYNGLGIGQEAALVKLEKPLNLDGQLESEVGRIRSLIAAYESGGLSEAEYKARLNIVEDRADAIDKLNGNTANCYAAHYFVLYDKDVKSLLNSIAYIRQLFNSAGMEARLLDKAGLYEYIKLSVGNEQKTIQIDDTENVADIMNDEKNEQRPMSIDNIPLSEFALNALIPDKVDFNLMRTKQDNKTLTHFVVNGYPLNVNNAWGAGLFDMPNTKVVMKLTPVEKSKAIKRIDNAITELSGAASNKASSLIDKATHIGTLSALLTRLQNDNETLLDVTLTITAYDEQGKNSVKRTVKRKLRELGFSCGEAIGRQADAYLTTGFYDKLKASRGIQSSTVAACFPFVSNAIVEENGLLTGENELPVFVDFFKRDSERVNSNTVIVGKPGSGKSYAAKTLLCNLASGGTKIFVLDPENEYGKLAASLGGKVLDAGSPKHGIINPFQIIGSLRDENDGEAGNDFYAHLRFLEQFFKLTFAGLNSDCMEILNKAALDTYRKKGVTGDTRLEDLNSDGYPTFDDLAKTIDEMVEAEADSYTLSRLKIVQNYLSKFKSGGRNSALWNGASSFGLSENFVVFNFQRLLADKNEAVANAQMLLILKWLENEVIKNREYNSRNGTSRKIAVVIDEAHLFIDEQYPVALDFMFRLAKRIRKYDGMQIVITQNIKDFAGTPEIARKSTAIINVSQYSLIFSLSPDDMTDLCSLYAKAGEINKSEQASIVYNPRGRAFFIYGSASRTNIGITATPYVESLFM
jgi:type IV secretory pathway VirB4 component